MSRHRRPWNILILILLVSLILSPRLLAGWRDLRTAQQLSESGASGAAAVEYASAARRIPWRQNLWESAGVQAVSAGQLDTAIVYLQLAMDKDILSPDGWLALGDAYFQKGDMHAAVAAWENAPGNPLAVERLAQAYRSRGDLEAAGLAWRQLITLQPGNAKAHYQLGLLLAATDGPETGLVELMQASSDPVFTARVDALRAGLNVAVLAEEQPYALLLTGRALALQGEWDLAEIPFLRAVRLDEGYAPAWAWLGETRQHLGGEGLPYLEKAVLLEPGSAMIQILYGTYWQRQGEMEKAVEAFEMAVQFEPQNAAWHTALGTAYEQTGALPEAVLEYFQAVELDPQNLTGWRALALYSVNNNYDLSGVGLTSARKLIVLAPNDWLNRDIAGQVTLALSNFPDAEMQFQRAIQLATEQPEPHLHLAMVYLSSGNPEAAREQLMIVIDLDLDGAAGWQAQRLLEQVK